MIKYILDNYYNRFEEVKKENNLLDYTDLEIYTLRLLYNEKKDYSIEEETEKIENSIIKAKERKANIINEIFEKIKNNNIDIKESILFEYDIEKLEKIYKIVVEIIEKENIDYKNIIEEKYILSDVAKTIKEETEEIAVDEYQDINMLQEYIIKAVCNKNIFRVGDPKQSIYGFRNSRPELFVEKEKNLNNENKVIYLDKNFRSLENVLETTNNVFSRVMTKDTGIIEYNENHYLKKGRYITSEFITDDIEELKRLEIYNLKKEEIGDRINFFKPELLIINTEEIEKEKDEEQENYNENKESEIKDDNEINEEIEGLEKEAIGIAKRIISLKEEYSKKGKKLDFKDIVILLRSVNNRANKYQEILEKFNIPCYTDVNESFLEIPEVSLICSYLDIIENPLNDINMLAVLRSYFFDMDIDEFTRIKITEKELLNGVKENNFYESILVYISYIKEKMDEEKNLTKQKVSFEERILYNKCLKIVSELERLKKLEEKKGLYEVVKDIVIESRLLYSN